jgi:hypothetical protein
VSGSVDGIKKILEFVIEGGNIAEEMIVLKGAERWMQLARILDEAAALAGVEWSKLGEEFKGLTPEQREELLSFAKVKFDLDNDELEAVIEDSIVLAVMVEEVVRRLIGIVKRSRK